MKLLLENWRQYLKKQEGEYQIYCDMDGVLVDILTAPMGYGSEIGKQAWIDTHLQPPPSKVFMSHDKFKWAAPSHILIDDFTKNTVPWDNNGGIAILHTDADKTIKKLEELSL